jgi:hypothetical protein
MWRLLSLIGDWDVCSIPQPCPFHPSAGISIPEAWDKGSSTPASVLIPGDSPVLTCPRVDLSHPRPTEADLPGLDLRMLPGDQVEGLVSM